jgi:hypothetical protein
MNRFVSSLALSALVLGAGGLAVVPAAAQQMDNGWQSYNAWQPGWNHGQYDRHHVVLGTVVKFSPYRVTVQRENGNVQTVDLKGGTVIRPTGATPSAGDRIAMVGYWSNGTFIVSRLILH